MRSELGQEFIEISREYLGCISEILPDMAKMMRKFYDELLKEGFTPDQAMTLIGGLDMKPSVTRDNKNL